MKLFNLKKEAPPKGFVIPIAGGLGGQILGYNLYCHLKNKGLSVYADACDLLASNGYRLAEKGQGLNTYVWDLGYYEIEHNRDPNILGNRNDIPRGLLTLNEGGKERAQFYAEALENISPRLFPVNKNHERVLHDQFGDHKLLVVHVRQSDYLNVASLVIRAEESISLVKKLKTFNPDRLIFASDGPLDTVELSKKIGFSVESFASSDYFLVHALLRRADILVAANSQFSLTAGLLGSAKLAFFPKNFFGGAHSELNILYQKPFNYFVR